MRYFFIALLSIVFLQPVFAQDQREQIDDMLGQVKKVEKAPQTVAEYTQRYQQSCLRSEHPIIAGRDLNALCQCVAERFPIVMTLEQFKEMDKATDEGTFQKSRMMLFVYTPCLRYPIYSMIHKECAKKTNKSYFMKNQAATCECLASNVADDIESYAPQYIQGAMKHGMTDIDPLNLLVHNRAFDRSSNHNTSVCLRLHERL